MTATTWIALYAAIVATATFAWNVLRARGDSGHISLIASITEKKEASTFYYYLTSPIEVAITDKAAAVSIRITNTGRRPVTLVRWVVSDGKTQGKGTAVSGSPTLAESQTWQLELTSLESFRSQLATFYVTDTHNRNWPLPQDQLANLRDAMLRNRL